MRVTRSLRGKLLAWLLIPLSLLFAFDAGVLYQVISSSVNVAHDRILHASALSILEHVTLLDGEPVVDMPPVALEILALGEQERVFYRVAYDAPGHANEFITGYEDLPLVRHDGGAAPTYHDETYRGDAVRIVALTGPLAQDPAYLVTVEVAQTLVGRGGMRRTLLLRALTAEIGLILLAAALVWLAVRRGLAPLQLLSAKMARRSPTDLTPVEAEVPSEVTPLVEATNELMRRVREAIAAQRRFIADAAHQLRTPLAVLRAEAEAAERKEELASVKEAIRRLREHSEATSHLANQLLSLARAEPGQLGASSESVDLATVAQDACALLVPTAYAREIDLGFEGDGPAPVHGHPVLLREAVTNLVDNAVRYGRAGGHVTVSVTPTEAAVVLAVEDDGPGIPVEQRSRVLERFYRLPGTAGIGSGLGLAIVHEIAHRHGATLQLLDAISGAGLRVEITFPFEIARL
jgi:two-component system sensor histidine kinase TctE